MPNRKNAPDPVRMALAVLLFVALAGASLAITIQQLNSRIAIEPSWPMLAFPDAKVPPAVAEQARASLGGRPLDQATLNLLFAIEARGDLTAERRRAFVDVLRSMGWRDTTTQQNMIVESARQNNPRMAVLHIDALLRRAKLVNEIMPVLAQIEAIPEARALLTDRLLLQPQWRLRYFQYSPPLANPVIQTARIALLNDLLDRGDHLSRKETRVFLDALIRAGRRADAAEIAMRVIKLGRDDGLIYDPTFTKFLALDADKRENPLPFEWVTVSQSGAFSDIVARGDGGQLQLRKGGVGVPTLARTMTLLRAGQASVLTVKAAGVDARQGLDAFAFALVCSDAKAVPLVSAGVTSDRNVVRYRAASALCDYPDLVIVGRPGTGSGTSETAIDAIHLTAAEGGGAVQSPE